ncbi:MAG: hypothetical protein LJE91_02390 [Gammaproteobacteria bacterium]|nr:hypothetical protein [Gammaproteobacteria bacterium]
MERILERIVMRAIDVNEHIISELSTGEGRSTRLTYRDTFKTCLQDYRRYLESVSGFVEQQGR